MDVHDAENTESTPISQDKSKPRRPTRPPPELPLLVDIPPHSVSGDADVIVQSPTEHHHNQSPSDQAAELTPLRAHYLKKSLLNLQFSHELDAITSASTIPNVSTVAFLGPPFTSPPKGSPYLDLPFLKYIFRQFVLTFPFLAAAPKDFFPDKFQPFIASVLSRNLSPISAFDDGVEQADQASRLKILSKLEKNLALLLGAATKLVEKEEVVRLTQVDLDRLEMLAKKRKAREQRIKNIFEVNVVCIRAVVDKGRVRSKVHEEFIVRTRRSNLPDVFVSRRYGDFKTLADELRKMHPEELVRPPPAKDRTSKVASPTTATSSSPRGSSTPINGSTESLNSWPSGQSVSSFRLAREKNRLTLRAYLHTLMSSSTLASSPVLRSFLLSNPTQLSADEMEDTAHREEADHKRDEGRKRFAREIADRVEGLRGAVKTVKGDVMAKDGLTRIFATIKVTEDVRNLPIEYQAVLEWARISLASTIFQHFIAADDASETLAGLKRIHGLMPYFMLKGILKISNPVGMIRGVLDLFLAQPFGGRSLLQRMFTSSMQEEVKVLEEEIAAVKDKIEDDVICEKIRQFINSPREIQDVYKADAAAESLNLLTVVLRSGEEPALTRHQMHRVMRAHRAHAAYLKHKEGLQDSDDDDGPQDDDGWLFEDLQLLGKLYSRLRDREQLIALIFEGTTADLLKDMITIFYAPLAQVYKAASIADSLGDLQNFINDLIRTVEQADYVNQDDPHGIVRLLIDLVHRHEQAFYGFVHKVHSKGENLFDGLMKWIELFLTIAREGLGERISLEYLLPHTGEERANILKEVDEVALYHYKLKLAYEDKIRRRFGRTQGQNDADAEDEATQALVNSVVHDLSFGELVRGDADEIAAEESDDSDVDSSSDETDSEEESEESLSAEGNEGTHPLSLSHTDGPTQSPHHGKNDSQRTLVSSPPPRDRSRSFTQSSKPFTPSPLSAPPLPRVLSKHSPTSPLSRKPLPPSPSSPRSSSEEDRRHPPPRPFQNQRKKDKHAAVLKPPELEHIPPLLPLFVEMIRPLLRPQGV